MEVEEKMNLNFYEHAIISLLCKNKLIKFGYPPSENLNYYAQFMEIIQNKKIENIVENFEKTYGVKMSTKEIGKCWELIKSYV